MKPALFRFVIIAFSPFFVVCCLFVCCSFVLRGGGLEGGGGVVCFFCLGFVWFGLVWSSFSFFVQLSINISLAIVQCDRPKHYLSP